MQDKQCSEKLWITGRSCGFTLKAEPQIHTRAPQRPRMRKKKKVTDVTHMARRWCDFMFLFHCKHSWVQPGIRWVLDAVQ